MEPPEEIEQSFSDTSSDATEDISDESAASPRFEIPSFRFAVPHRPTHAAGTTAYDWAVLYQHYKHLYLALKAKQGTP